MAASLRRSTAMPTDGASAKFLYTILKQLDHKPIDWPAVASELDITNGHAARMRFSRFKQHMEGTYPTRRARGATTNPDARRKGKLDKRAAGAKGGGKDGGAGGGRKQLDGRGRGTRVKAEADAEETEGVKAEPGVDAFVKAEPVIKEEAAEEGIPAGQFAGFGISGPESGDVGPWYGKRNEGLGFGSSENAGGGFRGGDGTYDGGAMEVSQMHGEEGMGKEVAVKMEAEGM